MHANSNLMNFAICIKIYLLFPHCGMFVFADEPLHHLKCTLSHLFHPILTRYLTGNVPLAKGLGKLDGFFSPKHFEHTQTPLLFPVRPPCE